MPQRRYSWITLIVAATVAFTILFWPVTAEFVAYGKPDTVSCGVAVATIASRGPCAEKGAIYIIWAGLVVAGGAICALLLWPRRR